MLRKSFLKPALSLVLFILYNILRQPYRVTLKGKVKFVITDLVIISGCV